METKTKELQLEKFVNEVNALGENLLDEKKGLLLLAYNETEDNAIESTFLSRGKLSSMAECLYACMKKNEMLANIIIAAANAIVQGRMIEAQIQAEAMAETKTPKKKRTKKAN